MNNITIYRPYKVHARILPFTVTVGVFAFIAMGYCIPYWEFGVSLWVVMGVGCIWLTKVLYDTSNLTVIFEQQGLRIVEGRYNNYRYVLWEELLYAYYVRNFKGHLFLVLSTNALSPKEAKRFANIAATSSRICIDDVLVIYINFFQEVSQIKELINSHIIHIDTY